MKAFDPHSIIEQFAPDRDQLLMMLHALQDSHPQHYLPEDALLAVAQRLNMTRADLYGVVSYYSMFSLHPRGRYVIRICQSPVCNMLGSGPLIDALAKHLDVEKGRTTDDGLFTLEAVECLGLCAEGPAMMINECVYTGLTLELMRSIVKEYRENSGNGGGVDAAGNA